MSFARRLLFVPIEKWRVRRKRGDLVFARLDKLIVVMLLTSLNAGSIPPPLIIQRAVAQSSDDIHSEVALRNLSLEEKVGQLLQIRCYGQYQTYNDPAYATVRRQIQQFHIGSIDLGARMLGPNLVKGTPLQVASILNELQRTSRIPLLVAADLERGLASRVAGVPEFPFPMAFGAISDSGTVGKFAALTAQQARGLRAATAIKAKATTSLGSWSISEALRFEGEYPIRR